MNSPAAVKQLEAAIREDVKRINELPKLVKALQNEDKAIVQAAIQSVRRLLLHFADKGDLKRPSSNTAPPPAKKAKTTSAETKFSQWLWDIYVHFIGDMLTLVTDSTVDPNLQVHALRTLMEFVARESEIKGESRTTFSNETFMRLIRQLLHGTTLKNELESVFKGEYVGAYSDVQYYTLKNMANILDKHQAEDGDYTVVNNALRLLAMVHMPETPDDITSFLTSSDALPNDELVSDSSDDESSDEEEQVGDKRSAPNTPTRGLNSVKQHEYAFSLAWIALLRHPLPPSAYKQILTQLPDDIMPHLRNPLLLADFLTDSYEVGGVTSLLALNSLFVLIQEYNFDYPDFYTKLYRLLADRTLLTSKQRDRFFRLLHLFLSSTHLPAYMIAAFAKRLARLALFAEPGVILFVIPMVYNLIVRHQECLQLIHRTGTSTASEQAKIRREQLSKSNAVDAAAKKLAQDNLNVTLEHGNDPFDNETQDPKTCHALQSSLWELHSMRQHYNADVAIRAKVFEEKLKTQFLDIEPSLDITYKSLVEKQVKRKGKGEVPLAFREPQGLFQEQDAFSKAFAVEQ